MKTKNEETWEFDVIYKLKESPLGAVDGAIHDSAKTRDEYYDKAKLAIDAMCSKDVIPAGVVLVHTVKSTYQQDIGEFSNSYYSVQGCKPKVEGKT
jgi:hypothetical protein